MNDCVIYCRVSSEHQMTGHGLQRQLETCLAYAKENGLSVSAVFSEARSGVDELPARRTAELMAAKRKCPILCEDASRWSRKGTKDLPPDNVIFTSKTSREMDAVFFSPQRIDGEQ